MAEFDVWAERIISGTLLPVTDESMKFALASEILHLGPLEDHRDDAYFIHRLRKSAVNQIAAAKMEEIRNAAKARLLLAEAEQEKLSLDANKPGETSEILAVSEADKT